MQISNKYFEMLLTWGKKSWVQKTEDVESRGAQISGESPSNATWATQSFARADTWHHGLLDSQASAQGIFPDFWRCAP
jgi:hypothetical protein